MLTVKGLPELQATARLFRELDKPTRAAIRKESQAWAPTLRRAAMMRARDPVSRAVAASGRITVTAKGLRAVFGATGRFHGEPLRNLAAPWEFGTSRPQAFQRYLSRHRLSHRAMQVTRRTQRQVPRAVAAGRFIYPAVADTTPDLVGRWVRAIAGVVGDR